MKKSVFFAAIAVFVAIFALFAPSIVPGHLSLDDWGYVNGCPFVKGGLSPKNFAGAFTTVGHGGIWMPVTSLTYMATISLFGDGWTAHHAVSVLLHALNATLVFLLFLKLYSRLSFLRLGTASIVFALAAVVWAGSPCRAEAVAWIASRKEELWTLFAILALFQWIKWLERGKIANYVFTMAFFVLSCLSKPTAMCFPAIAFAVSLLVPSAGVPSARSGKRFWAYLSMLAVSAATGAVAMYAQAHPAGMAAVDIAPSSLGWRLFNAFVSCGIYIFHTILPYGVHADWRLVENGWPVWGVPGLCALAAYAAAFAVFMKKCRDAGLRKAAVAASVWFFAALAPVLGVFGQAGDDAVASRWSYMAAIGPVFFAGAAAASLGNARRRGAAVAALAVFAAASSALAVPAIRSYADDRSSALRTLSFDPGNWRALRTVGRFEAAAEGRMDEGVDKLRRSLAARPSKQTADALAYVLACRGAPGDFAEVRRICRAAVRDPSRDPGGMMLDALGTVAMREGDDASAERFFSASLVAPERAYSNVHTILNLGLVFANLGKRADALVMLLKLHSVPEEDVRRRALEAIDAIKDRDRARFEWR